MLGNLLRKAHRHHFEVFGKFRVILQRRAIVATAPLALLRRELALERLLRVHVQDSRIDGITCHGVLRNLLRQSHLQHLIVFDILGIILELWLAVSVVLRVGVSFSFLLLASLAITPTATATAATRRILSILYLLQVAIDLLQIVFNLFL